MTINEDSQEGQICYNCIFKMSAGYDMAMTHQTKPICLKLLLKIKLN